MTDQPSAATVLQLETHRCLGVVGTEAFCTDDPDNERLLAARARQPQGSDRQL